MTILNGVPDGPQERDAANRGGQGQGKQKNETASGDPGAGSASEAIVENVSTGKNTAQSQADYQKEANKDPIVRYTRWLMIFTGLLFFSTGLSTWFLYKTDKSVGETLILGQRAFVHLENIEISPAAFWIAETKVDRSVTIHEIPENKGKYLRTVFSITNAGNTPTKLTISIGCGFGDKLNDPFDILKRDAAIGVDRFVGARQTITVSTKSCNFEPGDPKSDARMTTDPVFLAGKISYEDWVQHHTHVTEFGHRMVITSFGQDNRFTSMSVTTEPAGVHNCADEDCPGYVEEDHSKSHFFSLLGIGW